jgi:hypothetical protein
MNRIIYAMQSFYNESKINFKDIDSEQLNRIIKNGKKINEVFKKNHFNLSKCDDYLRIMKLLNFNHRNEEHSTNNIYSNSTHAEKYLLLMFGVDPDFEAAIIYGSEDRTNIAKAKIREKIGIYDPNLLKIEKTFIKLLLDEQKRKEINDEIEKRAFK